MTAVEWLEHIYLTIGIDRSIHFNQAKEQHRQEVIDAVLFGMLKGLNIDKETDSDFINNYYNQAFKK